MIRLRVLGSLELRDDGARELTDIVAQPKRVALLAYLATAMPAGLHRRDKVLAFFWPEFDDARARAALNSAARFLRRGLGNHVVVTRGSEEIGIDPQAFWCDAVEMRRAVAEGRHHDVLSLYRGDLLAGFFLDDSPAFDAWLEQERAALRLQASRAARAISERALRDQHVEVAVSHARRAFELAPDDERTLRHLLQLLDGVGDRVGAIQTYESYARRVADDYDALPAPETHALIERIRVRDTAHFSASNRKNGSEEPALAGRGVPDRPDSHRTGRSTRALVAAGVVLTAGVLLALGALFRPGRERAVDRDAIAVLPFRVTGADSSLNYLREGIIDLANVELGGEAVDSRTILSLVRREVGGERGDIDSETALRLARRVGARQVLLGELVATRSGLTGSARVLRARDGRVLARHAESGAIDVEVVRRLVRRALALAGGEARDRLGTVSDSAEAVRAYLAGMAAFRDGGYDASVRQFRRAVGIDSAFALGWLWLSTASMYTGADHLYARIRAWSLRDALSARDRTYLAAIHEVQPRTARQKVEAYARAAAENPDRPEVLRMWAIAVGIEGAAAGIDGWLGHAVAAADSAIALDSSFAPAVAFRLELALRSSDRAQLARSGPALLARLPNGPGRELLRWAVARRLGDSTTAASVRRAFPRLASAPDWSAVEVIGASVVYGFPLDDAELIAATARQAVVSRDDIVKTLDRLRESAAIRGRGTAARAYSDSIVALGATSWFEPVADVMLGLTDPGFERVAERAAGRLEYLADTSRSRAVQAIALCHAQLWRISQRDTAATRAAIGRLQQAERAIDPNERWWWVDKLGVCSILLEAALESQSGTGERAAFRRLESAMREGLSGPPAALALLMMARWYEAGGDPVRALGTLRRRVRVSNAYYYLLEPEYLREEGRLATMVHDTAGGIRAYRQFLAIRDRPDPGPMYDDVRWVRERLSELVR